MLDEHTERVEEQKITSGSYMNRWYAYFDVT